MSAPDPMQNFRALSHDQQLDAIRRMAAEGASAYTIAAATRLSVEVVRLLIHAHRQDDDADR